MAYPALPASPTLTNPDMILPYGDYDSTPSPPQHAFRPHSPDNEWREAEKQYSIGPPSHLLPLTPTTPIIYGNGTMLSDIGEVTEGETTPGRRLPGPAERKLLKQQARAHTPLRSSPTIGFDPVIKRSRTGNHERKVSVESTSTVTSDGQAAELFRDFDDGVSVDDSNFQGDDEQSVADSYSEEVIASETQRLSGQGNPSRDEDQNSSAALSRRAEQILLNAKKRLNNMEGNLTRARSSLYVTSSGSLSSIHSSSPLSRSTPSPQDNSNLHQLSKYRQVQTHSQTMNSSPGHSRVYSENSIAGTPRTAPVPVRSASAAARYIGKGTMDRTRRSPLVGGDESLRETTIPTGITSPSSKSSPPRAVQLEPLTEDDVIPKFEADRMSIRSSMDGGYVSGDQRGLTRSASSMQMRDLRDQMSDLKGRLSVLRDRARDDTMKRRSLQSLRTPSPFTAAEQWYTAAQAYAAPGLSADAGVGHSPSKEVNADAIGNSLQEASYLGGERKVELEGYANSEVTSVYEDVSDGGHAMSEPTIDHEPQILEEDEHYNTAGEDGQEGDDHVEDYDEEIVNRDELDDYESDASLYHDTMTISHEDREDAFDYEHFFLHSAMGTISQQRNGRRDSFSSEDSVETTRGPYAANNGEAASMNPRASLGHFRSESTDTVSTMATFATATEGLGSEDGYEEALDEYAVQDVPPPRPTTPSTAAKSGSFNSPESNGVKIEQPLETESVARPSTAIHDPRERTVSGFHRPSIASFDSYKSTGTTRSFPLINKPKSQGTLGSNRTGAVSGRLSNPASDANRPIDSPIKEERFQPSPVHMLVKDDQILVERVVESLGKCVLGLQESSRGSYEGRVWRRRLDAARRTLEGDEGAV